MGLALHCYRELKLTKWKMEEKEIQRGRWSCSHKPYHSSKLSKSRCSSSKMSKMCFPSRKQKKKSQVPPGGGQVPPGGDQQWRLAGACLAPGWRLSGAWRWRPVAPSAVSVSPGASCWYFCSSPCYSGSLICLDFWSKASNLQKGHKNGD